MKGRKDASLPERRYKEANTINNMEAANTTIRIGHTILCGGVK